MLAETRRTSHNDCSGVVCRIFDKYIVKLNLLQLVRAFGKKHNVIGTTEQEK